MSAMVQQPASVEWKPWLAFAAISFIWGSTWLAHKFALADLTPIGLMTLRLALASVLCLALGRMLGERFPDQADLLPLMGAGLVLTGLANVLTSWSLTQIPSGVGAVLQAPIPVWMALFSLKQDPLSKTGWVAVFLGLAGVALISWPAGTKADLDPWACLVCVFTAAIWSWASLYQRKHVNSGGLYTNAALQMAQGSILGAVYLACGGEFLLHGEIGHKAWISIAYLVVFGSCIAFAAYLYLTKVWHPARAGSFSYLNPIVAVLIGSSFGGEALNTKILLGLAIILAAVGVLQLATMRDRRQTESSAASPIKE